MGARQEYEQLEQLLHRAQEEIGDALVSLQNRSLENHRSRKRHKETRFRFKAASADRNANPVYRDTSADSSNSVHQLQEAVDFLSIFAADNLISDHPDSANANAIHVNESWSKTLPSSFRKKKKEPERPRTLTPPPQQPSRKRFRKRDWKFYVHGKYKTLIPVQQKHEYGFEPIRTDNTFIKYGVFKPAAVVKEKKSSSSVPAAHLVDNRKAVDSASTCDKVINQSKDKTALLHKQIKHEVLDNTAKPSSTVQVPSTDSSFNSSDIENSNIEIRLEPLNFFVGSAFQKVQSRDNINAFRPVMHSVQKGPILPQSAQQHYAAKSVTYPSNATVSSNSVNSILSEFVVADGGLHEDTSSTDVASLLEEGITMDAAGVDDKSAPGISRNPLPIGTNIPGPHVVKPKATTVASPPIQRIQPNSHRLRVRTINNGIQHEGTMTSLSEGSASDGYHREISLSPPVSPGYRSKPSMSIPPPPELDKHEARLHAAARHKTAERKSKKSRSKSREKRRDGSPSKTERTVNGKVSCATQTKKSIKNSKYGAKGEPPAVLPEPPTRKSKPSDVSQQTGSSDDPFVIQANASRKIPDTISNPPPGVDSSTSSDECTDSYKKVNMPALRERALQNRERTKNESNRSTSQSDTSIEINIVNGYMSVDPNDALNIVFNPVERCENDILETDLYSVEDDGDTTPVAEILDNCLLDNCACMNTSQRCDSCQIEQARQLHLEEQLTSVYHTVPYSHQKHNANQHQTQVGVDVHRHHHNKQHSSNSLKQTARSQDPYSSSRNGPKQNVPSQYDSVRSPAQNRPSGVSENTQMGPTGPPYYDDLCQEDQDESVLIPSREQRRLRTKPLMPVIVEDHSRSSDDSRRASTNRGDSESAASSLDRSLGRTKHRVNDTMCQSPNRLAVPQSPNKVPASPGGYSSSSLRSVSSNASNSSGLDSSQDIDNPNKPVSLLDRLHKKHYPSHYTAKPVTADPEKVRVVLSPVTSHRPLDLQRHEPAIDLKTNKPVTSNSPQRSAYTGPSKAALTIQVVSETKQLAVSEHFSLSPRLRKGSDERMEPRSPTRSKHSTSSFSSASKSGENSPATPDHGFEIEAIEACKWLRAAGFPQYAQMYEDQQFPIDVGSVQKDHDFLDQDSIQSLFRRLNTLNKCAVMKIEAPPRKNNEDSDEEEQCALSDKWKYTRSSRRWSRKDLDLSELSPEQQTVTQNGTGSQDSLLNDKNGNAKVCDNTHVPNDNQIDDNAENIHQVEIQVNDKPKVNLFDNRDRSKAKITNGVLCVTAEPNDSSPTLRRVSSEKLPGAKSFFKRIESLKSKKSKKPKTLYPPGTKLEIGDPVVQNSHAMKERMDKLGCRDISPKSEVSQLSVDVHNTSEDLNNSSGLITDSSLEMSPNFAACHDNGSHMSGDDKTTPSATDSDESLQRIKTTSGDNKKSLKEPSSPDKSIDSQKTASLDITPNQSASELEQIIFTLGSPEPMIELHSTPKVMTNGCIAMEDGSQINCRTGSFNMGSQELATGRVTPRSTRASSEDAPPLRRKHYTPKPQCRLSVYDNIVVSDNVDPQEELDKILADLMENISGLDQTLDQSLEQTTPTSDYNIFESGARGSSASGLNQEEPLAKLLKECNVQTTKRGGSNSTNASSSANTPLNSSCSRPHGSAQSTSAVQQRGISDTSVNSPKSRSSPSDTNQPRQNTCTNSDRHHQNKQTHPNIAQTHRITTALSGAKQTSQTSAASQLHSKEQLKQAHGQSMVDSVQQPTDSHQQHVNTVTNEQQHSQQPLENANVTQTVTSNTSLSHDYVIGDVMETANIPSTSHDVDSPTDGVDSEEAEEEEDARSTASSCSHHDVTDEEGAETAGSRDDDSSDQPEVRERRDSGVGSSLTRAPSDRRRHRIRWHSFVKSHRPSLNSENLQVASMSAGQLMVLRKLCLLKVTSLMEKYSPSNRSGWNWAVPKFIKRFKSPDYKDKNVFGVPLLVILQRTGQPLPQCMLYAMRCLRRTAMDAVGIFRKSGVRSRIQKLRDQVEADPGQQHSVDFESLQPYDVADLIKQYFRELPECLLTNKLSETFISIFTYVPEEERTEALQCTCMLLPDENREVLQSLLLFLSDMASHSHQNQMTASNLAVCFAPSLFHMFGHNPSSSPKRGRKTTGVPDAKELQDQKAAHECLTAMISEGRKLFMVPEDLLSKCRFSYIEQGDPVPLEELGKKRLSEDITGDHTGYLESCIQGLLKESRDKFKGWVSVSCHFPHIDLAYKKVGDGHPLRLWKASVDVEAPPVDILTRVLRERHLWDVDLLEWRVIEKLDPQTEVFQSIVNSMAPHPARDFIELRSWRTQLPKGACVLVSTSVEHRNGQLLGGIRAVTLASRYLIEPCGAGKSRLTHICRIDIRGHTPEWYNKGYGHICANYIARIRDSFKQTLAETDGPETKI